MTAEARASVAPHRKPPASRPVAGEQVHAVIDAIPEPVFVLTARRDGHRNVVDMVYQAVNGAAAALIGKRRDELIGHGLRELLPDVHDTSLWASYLSRIEAGETVRFQVPWLDENGTHGRFALSAAPFDDGVIVTAHEVTDRVRVEDELRQERDFNKATLDVAAALIVVVDSEWRIVRFNRYCEALTGYREAEVIGQHYGFLVPLNERTEVAEKLEPVSPDNPVSQVNHWLTKDGELRLIRWNNAGLADTDGRRTHLIAIGVDITEQQRAEDALRSSETALFETASYARSLIEASLDPLVTISADGKVTDVNESTIRVTGVPREELVGTDFSEYFTDPDRARAAYQRVFAEGQVTDYPLTIRHRDGALTDVLYNAAVYRDSAGKVQGVFAAARDVTALRRAEKELAQRAAQLEAANRELARSNADLEQFAYVASHDLREPLRAISGPLTFVATRYRGRLLDEKAEEFIGYAVDGSQRMQSLIDGLLAYSRVGRIEGTFRPVDTAEVAKDAIAALRPMLERTGATVSLEPLPTVPAEPEQLSQVFQNLIGNAVKFVAPGVRPMVRVCAERVDTAWRFDITDNGIGISASDRDRVFAMFKRLHARDQYPGSGIGLAVVKKIVERHGGEVGVDDAEDGHGTRIWFTLPAVADETA